jgi:hypothetical protein
MIIVCELSFDDEGHVPFNAGLLATVHAAFPMEDISFYGAAQHTQELKKELKRELESAISWNEIRPPSPGTPYMRRFPREWSIIRLLLRAIPRDKTSRLLFTSAYPSTVLALKIARFLSSKRPLVQIVLHGMSGVVGRRYRHPARRIQDTRTALTSFGNKGIQYLVLEHSIGNTVLMSLPFLAGKIEVFEHPISPNESASDDLELIEPIRFGFLGLADRPKGFPAYMKLAKDITATHGTRAEFHVIGRFPQGETSTKGTEVLATKPGTTMMSRTEFVHRVKAIHFIILPHETAAYTLTTSGVLLDAVAWRKPVIARRIPIFEAMFNKYGDIGYLFSDDRELTEIVHTLLVERPNGSRYRQQMLNLRNAQKARAPESLAADYRKICERQCQTAG